MKLYNQIIECSKPKDCTRSFTPGPWNWTYTSDNNGKNPKKFEVYDSDKELGSVWRGIATLPEHRGAATNRANARLIAASPELLEALEVAQKWIEFSKQKCGLGQVAGGDWYIDQDTIKKAIAKATGGAE